MLPGRLATNAESLDIFLVTVPTPRPMGLQQPHQHQLRSQLQLQSTKRLRQRLRRPLPQLPRAIQLYPKISISSDCDFMLFLFQLRCPFPNKIALVVSSRGLGSQQPGCALSYPWHQHSQRLHDPMNEKLITTHTWQGYIGKLTMVSWHRCPLFFQQTTLVCSTVMSDGAKDRLVDGQKWTQRRASNRRVCSGWLENG